MLMLLLIEVDGTPFSGDVPSSCTKRGLPHTGQQYLWLTRRLNSRSNVAVFLQPKGRVTVNDGSIQGSTHKIATPPVVLLAKLQATAAAAAAAAAAT